MPNTPPKTTYPLLSHSPFSHFYPHSNPSIYSPSPSPSPPPPPPFLRRRGIDLRHLPPNHSFLRRHPPLQQPNRQNQNPRQDVNYHPHHRLRQPSSPIGSSCKTGRRRRSAVIRDRRRNASPLNRRSPRITREERK
ncbi:hypothetical protein CASFOL_008901 [Castilleja foliolosa]|uniref:Uncharacterized protein n=1 Tax=Castilleja foliolosa TaxID=1961234 RepID=A0ABD3E0B5_9LAMI